LELERPRSLDQLAEQDGPIAHDGNDSLHDRGVRRAEQGR
jgi:hypothetical protein